MPGSNPISAQLLRLRRLEQQVLRRAQPPSGGEEHPGADKKKNVSDGGADKAKEKSVSALDEEIRRLESEFNSSSSSSSDSESGGAEEEEHESSSNRRPNTAQERYKEDGSLKEVRDASGNVVILKSAIDDDRIAPLPKHLLPLPICKVGGPASAVGIKRKLADADAQPAPPRKADDRRKRVMFAEPDDKSGSVIAAVSGRSSGGGLAATVQELIKSYVPSSIEKRPLWCRCCQYQAQSEAEFNAHKQTERHKDNVALERKASTCKLCRKQFTSPDQLKEHVKGRAHKERLDEVRARQGTNENSRKFERI